MATKNEVFVTAGYADVTILEGGQETKPKLTKPAMRKISVQQRGWIAPSGSWTAGKRCKQTGTSPGAGQETGGKSPKGLGRILAVMTKVLTKTDSRASWKS